ncbi:hypothetical protein, partial [Serratia liquefaciens]|uniref:hypothetical protein n=1 Tax=Serratia liquefaciens TaxID=614 RepID=UPI0023625020
MANFVEPQLPIEILDTSVEELPHAVDGMTPRVRRLALVLDARWRGKEADGTPQLRALPVNRS